MKHQIFLGMAASSVPIRQGVAQLMEDLTHGGLRFIYFSPRNMRRSKPVASKIGIPVGEIELSFFVAFTFTLIHS